MTDDRKPMDPNSILRDEDKDPLTFLIECGYAYAEEYLISRPDLRAKIKEADSLIHDRFDLP